MIGGIKTRFSDIARHLSQKSSQKARHTMVWGFLLAVLIGITEFNAPFEDMANAGRNKMRSMDASGQVVVVGIDPRAVEEVQDWPWSYDNLGALVTKLDQAGAKRIFFDFKTVKKADPSENEAFVAALKNVKAEVYLNARVDLESATNVRNPHIPDEMFRQYGSLANSNFYITGYNSVSELLFGYMVSEQYIPSIASQISGQRGDMQSSFPIDYAIDANSIPYISAADVASNAVNENSLSGKDIIIGINNIGIEKRYWIVGKGPSASVFFSALGAETLRDGVPVRTGWLIPLILALAAIYAATLIDKTAPRRLYRLAIILGFIFIPVLLESIGIFPDIIPACVFLAIVIISGAWHKYKLSNELRNSRNDVSGLPNLNALREASLPDEYILVAARISNYVEILTALPANSEFDFVEQISDRLGFGTSGETLYHGDEGVFFWVVNTSLKDALLDQLAALQAIFRNPVVVSERKYDLKICFGMDVDAERSLASRMSSALLAAQTAQEDGKPWTFYDPSYQKDATWKLSMLSELDDAIKNGELWTAFQPKLDMRTRQICGAEALVRWDHPQHGAISPEDFILAAEKQNRIDLLTNFVLGKALSAVELLQGSYPDFKIAVNLSSRLLVMPDLIQKIEQAFIGRDVPKNCLILEVTETAAMSSSEMALQQLRDIDALGIGISIDDYGTGFSTLDYLRKCPASEVKIDRSFINMLTQSKRDRIMVNSTIELAHSLGQCVVAEGVEDPQTLEFLHKMGCDIAQGYLIARPMPLENLQEFLVNYKKSIAA